MKLFLTLGILLLAVPGVWGGCSFARSRQGTFWASFGIFLAVLLSEAFALILLFNNTKW